MKCWNFAEVGFWFWKTFGKISVEKLSTLGIFVGFIFGRLRKKREVCVVKVNRHYPSRLFTGKQ
jgi:hypothetical protein